MQRVPLAVKQKLQRPVDRRLPFELARRARKRLAAAKTQRTLPLCPRRAAVCVLERHEKGVIVEPRGIFRAEAGEICPRRGEQRLRRLAENRPAAAVELFVIDAAGVAAPIKVYIIFTVEQTVRREQVEVDEIRVAGKGRKRLIGRIAEAGRRQRQDLPAALAARGEKVDEVARRRAERADSVGGGQGGNVHQNAAFSHF